MRRDSPWPTGSCPSPPEIRSRARGAKSLGRRDQHRHVEMILEQMCRFDRVLVAAIDQNHALAGQTDVRECPASARRPRRAVPPSSAPALAPSADQPAVSRILAKAMSGLRRRPRRTAALPGCRRRLTARRQRPPRETARARRGRAGAPSSHRRRDSRAATPLRRAASCLRRNTPEWCACSAISSSTLGCAALAWHAAQPLIIPIKR